MPPGGRGGLVIFMKVIELQMMAMNYLSHPAKDGFFFLPAFLPDTDPDVGHRCHSSWTRTQCCCCCCHRTCWNVASHVFQILSPDALSVAKRHRLAQYISHLGGINYPLLYNVFFFFAGFLHKFWTALGTSLRNVANIVTTLLFFVSVYHINKFSQLN